jgi:hypothetical protein
VFSEVAADLEAFVEGVLDLLGWQLKVQDSFAPEFSALGVVFRFPVDSRDVVVLNRPDRIDGLRDLIVKACEPGALTKKLCATLRGRLQFARSQLFGRCGGAAFRLLGAVADCCRPSAADVSAAAGALQTLLRVLEVSRPRVVPGVFDAPWLLYTDGACEEDSGGLVIATIGAVIVDPSGKFRGHFGAVVPTFVLDALGLSGQRQVVGQAELLPILLARLAWPDLLRGVPVISFVDNDSARHALVAGYSPCASSARIVGAAAVLDAQLGVYTWVGRVPSESNPADGPSRLDFGFVLDHGSVVTEITDSELDGRPGVSWRAVLRALVSG